MPPMSDVAPTPSPARAFLAAREEASRARARDRLARVRGVLPELARVLFAFGAARVWVFGSVAQGDFDEGSDLDLAVAGLPPASFIAARVALGARCPIPFDLVELERAPASLREVILAEGQELARDD